MPYTPKYCCQCGEKIERINRRFWHSQRFCELCETDYRIHDLMPYLTGIGLVLVVFVINFYFQKPEKPLNIAANQLVSNTGGGKSTTNQKTAQLPNANSVQTTAQTNISPLPLKSPNAQKASETKAGKTENQTVEPSEKVYFCGAATKKGTPCSRRVRGGGRCWQHVGQAAATAQEKLIAGQ